MARVEKTAAVRKDLSDIWLYIANDNLEAADRYLDVLEETLRELAKRPGMGPACPELRVDLRRFPCGSHLIFYRPATNGIFVVRVLHGARDIPTAFQN